MITIHGRLTNTAKKIIMKNPGSEVVVIPQRSLQLNIL